MKNNILIATLAGAALGVSVFALARSSGADGGSKTTDESDNLRPSMRTALGASPLRRDTARTGLRDAGAQPAEAAGNDGLRDNGGGKPSLAARVLHAYQQEERKAGWATAAERSIRSYFADSFAGMSAALEEVDCRATRCLVVVSAWSRPSASSPTETQRGRNYRKRHPSVQFWAMGVDCGVSLIPSRHVPQANEGEHVVMFHCRNDKVPQPLKER